MNKKLIIWIICAILFLVQVFYGTILHEQSHVVWNNNFNCTQSVIEWNYNLLQTNLATTKANCTFSSEQERFNYLLGHQMVESKYQEMSNIVGFIVIAFILIAMN